MVTVLIRYLLSFSLLSCSKCFVCLCLFLFGVQTKVVLATSDLRLFIHIFNLFPSLPTPLPYKSAAAITSLLFTPSVGSPLNQMHSLELTDYLLLRGHWGKEDAANTSAFCLTSMEARWLIRAGGGGGDERAEKTGETVDRCQNNGSVTSALRNCCFTIIPQRVIQLTTSSFWVSETKLRPPQVIK